MNTFPVVSIPSHAVLLGGHSEVDPRLPIPNRTVKRLCADASADCPRESRSPPGAHKTRSPSRVNRRGALCFKSREKGTYLRHDNTPASRALTKSPGCTSLKGGGAGLLRACCGGHSFARAREQVTGAPK